MLPYQFMIIYLYFLTISLQTKMDFSLKRHLASKMNIKIIIQYIFGQ